MWGYKYGGGTMWLFTVVLVGGVIYYMLQASKSKGSDGSSSKVENPLGFLKMRYAKGELEKQEYKEKVRPGIIIRSASTPQIAMSSEGRTALWKT
jgi:uncharacterized membrane protein